MRFILIIDDTYSNQQTINHVENKVSKFGDNVVLDTFIIHDAKALDSDTEILMQILMKEKHRAPIIVDAKVAKFYPEILKLQPSIVLFKHETTISRDSDEYNMFTEALAASHGARIDYLDKEFHDSENDKLLTVVDITDHIATNEYYEYLSQIFKSEHERYPFILLPRCVHNDANYESELIEFFNSRNEYATQAGLASSRTTDSKYNDIEINNQHCDIAIHKLSDSRLSSKPISIFQKPV